MSNTSIGKYQIASELGRGAMGIVFRALDPSIERYVAIKVMRSPAYSSHEEIANLRMRLMREARAAGRLSHPGIVTVHHLEEESDFVYVVMEFVEGQTLDRYASLGEPCRPETCISILRQVAEALDYAHSMGIIHRDIKPSNILVGPGARVKITDFGIAKIVSQNVTQTGMAMGTPAYMSPEQIRAETLDGRADQFSLAVLAYEMLTGRKPFEAETLNALIFKLVTDEPSLPHEVNNSLSPQCSNVLLRSLSKLKEQRYPTCIAFVEALTSVLVTRPAAHAETGSCIPRPRSETIPEFTAPPAEADKVSGGVFGGAAMPLRPTSFMEARSVLQMDSQATNVTAIDSSVENVQKPHSRTDKAVDTGADASKKPTLEWLNEENIDLRRSETRNVTEVGTAEHLHQDLGTTSLVWRILFSSLMTAGSWGLVEGLLFVVLGPVALGVWVTHYSQYFELWLTSNPLSLFIRWALEILVVSPVFALGGRLVRKSLELRTTLVVAVIWTTSSVVADALIVYSPHAIYAQVAGYLLTAWSVRFATKSVAARRFILYCGIASLGMLVSMFLTAVYRPFPLAVFSFVPVFVLQAVYRGFFQCVGILLLLTLPPSSRQ